MLLFPVANRNRKRERDINCLNFSTTDCPMSKIISRRDGCLGCDIARRVQSMDWMPPASSELFAMLLLTSWTQNWKVYDDRLLKLYTLARKVDFLVMIYSWFKTVGVSSVEWASSESDVFDGRAIGLHWRGQCNVRAECVGPQRRPQVLDSLRNGFYWRCVKPFEGLCKFLPCLSLYQSEIGALTVN